MPPPPAASSIVRGRIKAGERIVIYGDGGLGKSTLASLAPEPVFIDIEGGTRHMDVARFDNVPDWNAVLAALRSPDLAAFKSVVIDSATKAQDLATAWTLANIKTDKGADAGSVEGYGFGKGYRFVYDTFMRMIAALDALADAGKHVIVIVHATTSPVPNPEGDDWLRHEPALQQPSKEGRIRDRVVAWADHVLFVGMDKLVKDGKATGGGSRTIYTQARPTYVAKSRTLPAKPIPFASSTDDSVWKSLGIK